MEPERYSAETKAWLDIWGCTIPLSRTNNRQISTVEPEENLAGEIGELVTSVDGVEHRRLIRITGGVAWEYEEIK